MSNPGISIPEKEISIFCRRYQVRQMVLFDPDLLDCFHPYGKIDVMLVFYPASSAPFYKFEKMECELSVIFRRPVSLVSMDGSILVDRDGASSDMKVVYAL